MTAQLSGVERWSKAHNRPILPGEFGAYEKGPMESPVHYAAWVACAAETLGHGQRCLGGVCPERSDSVRIGCFC
jgi:hypothetical protein